MAPERARTWTVLVAAADISCGGLKRPVSNVYASCCLVARGAAGGAGSRAGVLLLSVGAILCARFRPAGVLALLVGPGQPAPLPLVHVHAPARAKLLLLSRFKGSSLFFREIDADLHCFVRVAKPDVKS